VKAFDSVNREMMWKTPAKYGILEPLINVIVKVFTDIEVSTSVWKAKATFSSASGVKKGDNLAPSLSIRYSPSKSPWNR
jgi:hypothetical protein